VSKATSNILKVALASLSQREEAHRGAGIGALALARREWRALKFGKG